MKLLLDTHIWVWSSLYPRRINRRIAAMIESQHHELWLSAVSIQECAFLSLRGRIKIQPTLRSWVVRELSETRIQVADVDREIALETASLSLSIGDPMDRFIVATAIVRDYTLITADQDILGAKACRCVEA